MKPAQALYAQTCYEPAPSYAAVSLDCQGTSHDALNSSFLSPLFSSPSPSVHNHAPLMHVFYAFSSHRSLWIVDVDCLVICRELCRSWLWTHGCVSMSLSPPPSLFLNPTSQSRWPPTCSLVLYKGSPC